MALFNPREPEIRTLQQVFRLSVHEEIASGILDWRSRTTFGNHLEKKRKTVVVKGRPEPG
jgi:hypothetical protein